MSIMFDDTHKKIDVSKINKNRRKLNVSVGSILLSLTLLSGCGKADKLNNNEVDNIETSQSITYVEEEIDAVDLEESTEKIEIVEHDLNEKVKLPDGFNMIEMNDIFLIPQPAAAYSASRPGLFSGAQKTAGGPKSPPARQCT